MWTVKILVLVSLMCLSCGPQEVSSTLSNVKGLIKKCELPASDQHQEPTQNCNHSPSHPKKDCKRQNLPTEKDPNPQPIQTAHPCKKTAHSCEETAHPCKKTAHSCEETAPSSVEGHACDS
ncbi:unnamed protein product [Arctia plantaginis]|uniref:Secreted protein n=1 Tax=Arctia plantaginis TaxID=874455 RepID=A0A8S0YVA1_ARCPL|nr:unnamed protein product [Arctia plantaginis]